LSWKLFELSSSTPLPVPPMLPAPMPAQRSIARSRRFSCAELLLCFSLGAKPGTSSLVRLTARAKATALSCDGACEVDGGVVPGEGVVPDVAVPLFDGVVEVLDGLVEALVVCTTVLVTEPLPHEASDAPARTSKSRMIVRRIGG
jgi:hypothetical protein